jgi:hypothetical protein
MWQYFSVSGMWVRRVQPLPVTTCRFYLSAAATSLVYIGHPPPTGRPQCLHATLGDHHAALSARPKLCQTATALHIDQFYPLSCPISFMPTKPDFDDDTESPVQHQQRWLLVA